MSVLRTGAWDVLAGTTENYNHSDYKAIIFELWREPHGRETTYPRPRRALGSFTNKMDSWKCDVQRRINA